jgi:hypothetical protein
MTDMQPENSPAPNGPEQQPVDASQNQEHIPVLPTPEAGVERVEQTTEASAAAVDATYQGVPVPPPPVVPVATTQAADDSPIVAGDEDVIEKEWVDQAKKIILETKDDPFARTNRVNELQRNYLKKRYSKDLGVSE